MAVILPTELLNYFLHKSNTKRVLIAICNHGWVAFKVSIFIYVTITIWKSEKMNVSNEPWYDTRNTEENNLFLLVGIRHITNALIWRKNWIFWLIRTRSQMGNGGDRKIIGRRVSFMIRRATRRRPKSSTILTVPPTPKKLGICLFDFGPFLIKVTKTRPFSLLFKGSKVPKF